MKLLIVIAISLFSYTQQDNVTIDTNDIEFNIIGQLFTDSGYFDIITRPDDKPVYYSIDSILVILLFYFHYRSRIGAVFLFESAALRQRFSLTNTNTSY